MPRKSAGILLYRLTSGRTEVFLVHPGGPLWARKDDGAWSIPKGEFEETEAPLEAAIREFLEETGISLTETGARIPEDAIPLAPLRQPSGKVVYAWAVRGDLDPSGLESNTFELEWPPRSGRRAEFPEVDRAEWLDLEEAKRKVLKGEAGFIEELEKKVNAA